MIRINQNAHPNKFILIEHKRAQHWLVAQLDKLSSCGYNGRMEKKRAHIVRSSEKIKGRCVFSTILNCLTVLPTKLKRFYQPRVNARMLYAYHISMSVFRCVPCVSYTFFTTLHIIALMVAAAVMVALFVVH